MSYSWLPGLLGEIAEAAGAEAALKVAETVGGTRISIPPRIARRNHWLAQCVGLDAAQKICEHFRVTDADGRQRGVRHVVVPLGPAALMKKARRQLARELLAGASPRQAARKTGLAERTAYRIKARLKDSNGEPGGGEQGSLF